MSIDRIIRPPLRQPTTVDDLPGEDQDFTCHFLLDNVLSFLPNAENSTGQGAFGTPLFQQNPE